MFPGAYIVLILMYRLMSGNSEITPAQKRPNMASLNNFEPFIKR